MGFDRIDREHMETGLTGCVSSIWFHADRGQCHMEGP